MFDHLSAGGHELTYRGCPACSEAPYAPAFSKSGFSYVRCRHCGAVYINPIPVERALRQGYDELSGTYFLDQRRQAVDRYPQRHARETALVARTGVNGALLDVGCATGSFLLAAIAAGFQHPVGIDIAGPSIVHAQQLGLDAIAGNFTAHIFDEARFDIVTIWNTLEHLSEPFAFVAEAHRVLKRSGWLAISVPNFGSLSVRLLGTKYRYIALAHLNYFTVRTLTHMVERAGFAVHHTETRSFNPYVVLLDWRGGGMLPGTDGMIRETELSKSFKTERSFAPARLAYHVVDRALQLFGLGDSLLLLARRRG